MSYLNEDRTSRRLQAVVGVGALHAALGSALLFGLAVAVGPERPLEPIVVTLDKPKPPVVQQEELPMKIDDIPVTVVEPVLQIDILPAKSDEVLQAKPAPEDGIAAGIGETAVVPIVPPEPVRVAPRALGGTVGLSTDDYPDASRRAGEEGQTMLSFTVGTDGRVKDCTIARTSGFERLDARACQVAERRWRFAPATVDGRAVETEMSRKVTWQLKTMK